MDPVKDCTTCVHRPPGATSIDDSPARCWDCVGMMGALKTDGLPLWEPKPYVAEAVQQPEKKKIVIRRIDKTEPNPMDKQVGGAHYKDLRIQPFEYSMANGLDPVSHTAIKYITRSKGGVEKRLEDLDKAIDCIEKLKHFVRLGYCK